MRGAVKSNLLRRPRVAPDDACGRNRVAAQRLHQFIAGETGHQLSGLNVGRHHSDHVMMERVGGRSTRPEIMIRVDEILAAGPILRTDARFTFRQRSLAGRYSIRDPVIESETFAAVGVLHNERKALGVGWGI